MNDLYDNGTECLAFTAARRTRLLLRRCYASTLFSTVDNGRLIQYFGWGFAAKYLPCIDSVGERYTVQPTANASRPRILIRQVDYHGVTIHDVVLLAIIICYSADHLLEPLKVSFVSTEIERSPSHGWDRERRCQVNL